MQNKAMLEILFKKRATVEWTDNVKPPKESFWGFHIVQVCGIKYCVREIGMKKAPEPNMVDEGWSYRIIGGCSKDFTVQGFNKK